MKISLSISRGKELEDIKYKSDLYVHDMGHRCYIVWGITPILAISYIKPSRSYQDSGWFISGDFGLYSPKLKKKFDSKERAIKKVVKFISKNLNLLIFKVDQNFRHIYSGSRIDISISGNDIKGLRVSSSNIYKPFKINSVYSIPISGIGSNVTLKPEEIHNEDTVLLSNYNFRRMVTDGKEES